MGDVVGGAEDHTDDRGFHDVEAVLGDGIAPGDLRQHPHEGDRFVADRRLDGIDTGTTGRMGVPAIVRDHGEPDDAVGLDAGAHGPAGDRSGLRQLRERGDSRIPAEVEVLLAPLLASANLGGERSRPLIGAPGRQVEDRAEGQEGAPRDLALPSTRRPSARGAGSAEKHVPSGQAERDEMLLAQPIGGAAVDALTDVAEHDVVCRRSGRGHADDDTASSRQTERVFKPNPSDAATSPIQQHMSAAITHGPWCVVS